MNDSFFDIGVREDVSKNYLIAIAYYERAILEANAPADVFINLSFLWWELTMKFPFRDHNKIPDSYMYTGEKRYKEILNAGMERYPENSEMIFWSYYFPYQGYFDQFTYEQAQKIVQESKDGNLVTYFFLYLFDKQKYQAERDEVVAACKSLRTAKNNWILSIADNEKDNLS